MFVGWKRPFIAESSNGRMAPSEGAHVGSNPASVTMNDLRSKYFWQVGHYVSGNPDNMENVDEGFLRTLEERAGIKEGDVIFWRYRVHREFLDGHSETLDKLMGYILADVGCVV